LAKAKRIRLYGILLIGPLFFLASHMWISAPTADIGAAVYALPGALVAICCLEEIFDRNVLEARNWLFLLTIIGSTLMKLKLSYAVLGGTAIGIAAIGLFFIQAREFYRSWIRAGILAAVVVAPWAVRGVALTGYPFYPSTFLRFRTDWAPPRKTADSERDWIYSWARWPTKDPDDVLHSDAWFGPWVERNAKDPENIFLFLVITGGLFSTFLSLAIPMSRQRRLQTLLVALPAALGLIFWFKTAPDPRFGYATLLLFGINGFYASGSALFRISSLRAVIFIGVVTVGSLLMVFRNEWPLISLYQKKFPQGFPKAALTYQTTNSGLRVGIANEQAWDSGLVVTPYWEPRLSLRGSELRDGFKIKQSVRR